ncbi:Smr domain-containing protein [Mycena venus]|uniref:Smr domain-containing protein n=1 Tax=Mycena venus TaxID=2733690 RepID=A0A8H6YQ79_9AGAR|nr:Smr domain-containing protein [Mycena venus]
MNPVLPLSIGFALRIFLLAFDPQSQLRPIFIGIWEGIAMYRGLSTTPTSVDAYVSLSLCALRLLFDSVFTENRNTMITLVFSLVLSVLISDVVGSHHGHDIQPSRRSEVTRDTVDEPPRSPDFHEVPDFHRTNRTRVIPRTPHETNGFATRVDPAVQTGTRTPQHQIVGFVISADRAPKVQPPHVSLSSTPAAENPDLIDIPNPMTRAPDVEPPRASPSPTPAVDSPVLIAIRNPITPPRTPPKRVSSPSPPKANTPSESENDKDELHTSLRLVVAQTPPLQAVDVVGEPPTFDDADQDELQTPLGLSLRALPPLTLEEAQPRDETRSLLLEDIPVVSLADDSASVLEADLPEVDADDILELSPQSDAQLSIISATNDQIIRAKAELLRKQAWNEEAQLRSMKEELERAVLQNKIKEAFLLRRNIETREEEARKLHGRAARRYFRASNLSRKDGEIDVHGLFIAEAVNKVETALEAAILSGRKELRVIVGRGRGSKDGQPKLRPAITREMQKQGIPCRIQAGNDGVLILTVP